MKQRTHNEWFQSMVSPAICPCGSKRKDRIRAGKDASVYAWGEYVVGRWRTVDYFCECCFQTRVIPRLVKHAGNCGCTFQMCARNGHILPHWITFNQDAHMSCAV
jgi:hypothetical protein